MPSKRQKLTGKKVGPDTLGAVASVHKQDVPSGEAPDSGINIIESVVTPQEEGQNYGLKQTTFFDSEKGEGWPTLYVKGLNERGDETLSTVTRVAPSDSIPAQDVLTEDITQTAETQDRAVRVVTEVVGSHSTLTSRTYDRERAAGEKANTVETIILPGSADDALPDLSDTVLDAEITQNKKKQSVKRVRSINGSQPTLRTWEYDQRTGLLSLLEKKIVAASTVPTTHAGMTSARSALALGTNDVLEYQPIDKWLSIQIVSKVPQTITNDVLLRSYPSSENYPFPDELTAISLKYAYTVDTTTGIPSYSVALHTEIKEGSNGTCLTLIREYLTRDPDGFLTRNPTYVPTHIEPEAYSLEVGYMLVGSPVKTALDTISVPATIHDELDVAYSNAFPLGGVMDPSFEGTVVYTLPPTSPITTPDSIIRRIETEQWRFGLYLMRVVKLFHPSVAVGSVTW